MNKLLVAAKINHLQEGISPANEVRMSIILDDEWPSVKSPAPKTQHKPSGAVCFVCIFGFLAALCCAAAFLVPPNTIPGGIAMPPIGF